MKPYLIVILLAMLIFAASAQVWSQEAVPAWRDYLVPDGQTVYDLVNGVTWLADADLPAKLRFDFPQCSPASTDPCIWADGSMSYTTAQTWVQDLNAYPNPDGTVGYLGHKDWQLPTTPMKDSGCKEKGPSNENFGFGCSAGAFGFLYYTALGISAPATAVPIPPNTVGPFKDFQPDFYWSQSYGGGLPGNHATFSFGNGLQGGSSLANYLYVLPMIEGKIPGTPPATGTGLEVNPDGKTIYDPVADVTWVADADLAIHNRFALPTCVTPTTPNPCVAHDGSMNYNSAVQFILNMNAYDNGAGYAGQTNWELPTSNANCPPYNCTDKGNPMGELFYTQLGIKAGASVVSLPNTAVGPFNHVQTDYYWTCEAQSINAPCSGISPVPDTLGQFDFSFGNGFLSTAREPGTNFVTAYYVGCDLHDPGDCVFVARPGQKK